ncbi:M23 family metallopeptidase [Sphingorhabdus sp.]|uniref:M23 family metallopeptidase n=1 Tax=Sphingorhabdus sp. TaxID=1902408 RepID=UPI003593096D
MKGRSSIVLLMFAALATCTATPPQAAIPERIKPVETMTTAAPAPAERIRADFWFSGSALQGGLIIGQAPSGTRMALLNGTEIPLTAEGFFLIGFDRDAENSFSLVALFSDGTRKDHYLPVAPGNWKIEHVAANPTGGAKTTEEFQARRGAELARINGARAIRSTSDGWRQNFIRPVVGRISGLFGAQRIYNGTPGSYHSGMDIAAPAGTPFIAPADGIVTLAAADAFTLEGHLLMIDHGMGLNSAFLHCSELLVKEGDVVKQGQIIGKVGSTGRASGPHLHWGMKWNSARIDPKLLIFAS